MLTKEQYAEIIALAAHAPSGDNAQPWKFVVRGNEIDLYNIPGKDSSPYNYKERGSLFAHGAIIENLVILFSAAGYTTTIKLFPDANLEHIARITVGLEKTQSVDKNLAEAIPRRRTNRKPYQKITLQPEHKSVLLEEAKKTGVGALHIIENPKTIAKLGNTLSLSDQLIFENEHIHDAIFSSIRWTPAEEDQRKGLYIKTLELPPPAQVLFKLLKNKKILSALNKIGISKFIASQSAKGYAASSIFGMITMPNDTHEGFVNAGRLFQRLWLRATQQGMEIQPVTALAYLAQRIHENATFGLSADHQKQILDAEKVVRTIFETPTGTIAMIFRAGYGKEPTAQSKKSIPEIVYA